MYNQHTSNYNVTTLIFNYSVLYSRTITGTVGLNKLLSSLNQEAELNDYDGKGTLQ